MIIHYKVKGTGSETNPFKCDLPEYNFLKKISSRVWEIEIPDSYGKDGKIYNEMIHSKYKYNQKQLDKIPANKRSIVDSFSKINFEEEQINR